MKKFLYTKSGIIKQDLFTIENSFRMNDETVADTFDTLIITEDQVQHVLNGAVKCFERILEKGQKVFYSEKIGWVNEWGEGCYDGFDEHIEILHSGDTMEKVVDKNKNKPEKRFFVPKPRGKAYHVYNSDHELHALYDESRSKIVQWSDGDDISSILTTVLQSMNISLYRDSAKFQESEGFPDKI